MKQSIFGILIISLLGFSFLWLPNFNNYFKQTPQIYKEEGIKFSNIHLKEAMELAKKNNKPIFIDCYAVWCGPCKLMKNRVFKNPEVGDFFNKNFINLKVEMEKDLDKDKIMQSYRVTAYPTLLFINYKGELIKKSIGYKTSVQLLEIAKSVINKK